MANLEQHMVQQLNIAFAPIEEEYRDACVRFAQDLEDIATTKIMGCCSVTLEQAQANMLLAAQKYNERCNVAYSNMVSYYGERIAKRCPEIWEQWQDGIITTREVIFKALDSLVR